MLGINGLRIKRFVPHLRHGWVGTDGGAFFEVIRGIGTIAVDKVPVSTLMDIYHLNGVVVVEIQNVMAPSNDIASKAAATSV